MDSLICRIAGKAFDNLKNYFRGSFIKRITDVKKEGGLTIIDECTLIRRLAAVGDAYNESRVMTALKNMLKRYFKAGWLKNMGLIIVSSVLANIIFAVIFGQKINPVGAVSRCMFLFIGLACLSSEAQWNDIKATSVTMRLLKFFYEYSSKR